MKEKHIKAFMEYLEEVYGLSPIRHGTEVRRALSDLLEIIAQDE